MRGSEPMICHASGAENRISPVSPDRGAGPRGLAGQYRRKPAPLIMVYAFQGETMDGATQLVTRDALESTQELVTLARAGDERAKDRLIDRCLPLLKRWARGRLPHYARNLAETDDLVQGTLLRTLQHLDSIELRGPGSFLAYMRQCLVNAVRDEIRRTSRRGEEPLDDNRRASNRPAEEANLETLMDYERSLSMLPDRQREAVILRVEFEFTFPEIAAELDMPSADAARMMVSRAMLRLAEAMK